jgi:hypothetical protein
MRPPARNLTRLGLGVAVTLCLLLPATAALAGVGGSANGQQKGYTLGDGRYRAAGGSHNPNHTGRPVEYRVELIPDPCTISDIQIGACIPGRVNCPGRPVDTNNDWRLAETFWREVGTDAWFSLGRECLNYAVIAPQVTPQLAREEILKRLPHTTFTLSPTTRGIVNLPEIVSVNQAQLLTFQVPILGQAVVLRVTAEHYDWTFGDGASLTTDTPGPPFEAGTACSADADCKGYVHHTYRSPGRYPVQVTLTWHGEFSVEGGAWQDIPQRLELMSPAVSLTVAETQVVGNVIRHSDD